MFVNMFLKHLARSAAEGDVTLVWILSFVKVTFISCGAFSGFCEHEANRVLAEASILSSPSATSCRVPRRREEKSVSPPWSNCVLGGTECAR